MNRNSNDKREQLQQTTDMLVYTIWTSVSLFRFRLSELLTHQGLSLRLPLNHSNSNCQDGHAQNSYFHHHRIAVHAIKHVLRLPLENHVEVVGKFRPRIEDARIIYSSSPVHPKQSTYSSIQTTLLSFTLIVRITLFAKTPLPSYTVSHVVCRFISVSSNDLHATLRTLPTP
mgnify:FL=1